MSAPYYLTKNYRDNGGWRMTGRQLMVVLSIAVLTLLYCLGF